MSFLPDTGSGEGVDRDLAAALAQTSDEQLEASIISLRGRIDAAESELAIRVAEFDRRGVADRRHVLTTKQWLRSRLRMSGTAAASMLRFGRALAGMIGLREAALAGSVPVASARALAAVRERHGDAFDEFGDVLVEAASRLSTRDLRRAIGHWEQHVAPEAAADEVGERFERRRLSVNQTFDGMWVLTGDLDPESGHVVDTTVRAIADPGNLDPEDHRTPGQRRADALTDACRFWLDHNHHAVTSGGVKPHITVTVDIEQLNNDHAASGLDDEAGAVPSGGAPDTTSAVLPEIDGTPIAGEDARRLACDADVVRIITAGESEVLDVGRSTRTVPSAVRRAIEHRDGACTWDGCDAPVGWCDAHHIEHWADGGPTSLDNLRLLCRRHHRAVHDAEMRRPRPPPDP